MRSHFQRLGKCQITLDGRLSISHDSLVREREEQGCLECLEDPVGDEEMKPMYF